MGTGERGGEYRLQDRCLYLRLLRWRCAGWETTWLGEVAVCERTRSVRGRAGSEGSGCWVGGVGQSFHREGIGGAWLINIRVVGLP